MTDISDRCDEFASEFLGSKLWEPALAELLLQRPSGEWVPVEELSTMVEDAPVDIYSLFATWLSNPSVDRSEYVIVILSEPDSGWTNTAVYNVERLAVKMKQLQAVA